MNWLWVSPHLEIILGFALALVVTAHMLHQRLSPSSTIAWLLVIVLLPYVGIPLYLILGGRKIRRAAARKTGLVLAEPPGAAETLHGLERLICSYGLPGASEGNALALQTTGEASYRALTELIDGARESLCVSTFILYKDEVGRDILNRLADQAKSGVRVRLLLDGYGSLHANREFLAPLRKAGGHAAFFMPMLHRPFHGRSNLRNHRKIVLADGSRVLAGGINIARDYLGPTADPRRWQDLSFLLEGPAVREYEDIFRSDWRFATREDIPFLRTSGSVSAVPGGGKAQVVPSGPDVHGDPLYAALLTAAYAAETRLWIVTPYFIPDEALNQAVCIAAQRGVDVRLLVPEKSNHPVADAARGTYVRAIQAAGGKVFLHTGGMLHAKALVMDDELAVLGSANFDLRSLFLNYEVAVFVYHADCIHKIAGWMDSLMTAARPGVAVRIGPLRDLAEGFVRIVAPLL